MPTFCIVKGKQGVLVGDPQRNGFIGQRKLSFTEDTAPKRVGERYEPCKMLCRVTPDLKKALKLKQVVELHRFEARSMKAAVPEMTRLAEKTAPSGGGGNK